MKKTTSKSKTENKITTYVLTRTKGNNQELLAPEYETYKQAEDRAKEMSKQLSPDEGIVTVWQKTMKEMRTFIDLSFDS